MIIQTISIIAAVAIGYRFGWRHARQTCLDTIEQIKRGDP